MEEKKLTKSMIYMIGGIAILIIAIAGSAYAYYNAKATSSISGNAAGAGLSMTVQRISTSADGKLIPLDNDTATLTKAVKGEGFTGTTYDASKSCIDKNGKTACQVYKVTVTNSSTVSVTLNGGVSSLSGTNALNLTCAVMNTETSVTSNNSCVGNNTLTSNDTINADSYKSYYFMVYIKNLNSAQTDSGTFNGTVKFTSIGGDELKADFSPGPQPLVQTISSLFSKTGTVTEDPEGAKLVLDVDTEHSMIKDAAGNIRYYGATPDNYIDIGDTVPWRIIGVFKDMTIADANGNIILDTQGNPVKKDLVKIIRSS